MGYAAIALAVVGFGLGVTFRFKVLLPVLVLLLIISIAYTATQGFNFPRAALAIIEVQSIVQLSGISSAWYCEPSWPACAARVRYSDGVKRVIADQLLDGLLLLARLFLRTIRIERSVRRVGPLQALRGIRGIAGYREVIGLALQSQNVSPGGKRELVIFRLDQQHFRVALQSAARGIRRRYFEYSTRPRPVNSSPCPRGRRRAHGRRERPPGHRRGRAHWRPGRGGTLRIWRDHRAESCGSPSIRGSTRRHACRGP